MRLRLPNDQLARLADALRKAGTKEIGGQLFGEQLEASDFRVTDLTIQKRRGSFARFFVDLTQAARDAVRFFQKTEHRYTQYNYIGEWHSHPSFAVTPSPTDVRTMIDLVTNDDFRGNFAALMIVRLDGQNLSMSAQVFDQTGNGQAISVEHEA